ncbi:MAG: glycosyltransferase [Clostridium butyricum]|uniref:glycosyltransferase n=1 Tax=Clostridium butyricum TaxID=1492 RepID=UPI00290307B6|nr:glycosyltransferase [Clostridium butyricum]MDU3582830.1 glycosyltransferase [Clostridium butyricum]MDU3595947.1 glycosyltransferase [Clostridium butyricum]
MDKKISIIIPVYNAEKYLSRCIESILKQSYKNFELILINDGSTDRSSEICDKYSNADNRIKVHHIENGGPAIARNKGLSMISGSYLTFVDADDEIVDGAYFNIVNELENCDVDMIVSSWSVLNHNKKRNVLIGDKILSSNDMIGLISINDEKYGGGYPWNKFINIEKIRDKIPLFDTSLFVYEDKVWVIEILKYINRVKLTNTISYKYYIYDFSLSHSTKLLQRKMENRVFALDKMLSLLQSIDSKYINEFYKVYCENMINISYIFIKQKNSIGKKLYNSNIKLMQSNFKYYNYKTKIKYYIIRLLSRRNYL